MVAIAPQRVTQSLHAKHMLLVHLVILEEVQRVRPPVGNIGLHPAAVCSWTSLLLKRMQYPGQVDVLCHPVSYMHQHQRMSAQLVELLIVSPGGSVPQGGPLQQSYGFHLTARPSIPVCSAAVFCVRAYIFPLHL